MPSSFWLLRPSFASTPIPNYLSLEGLSTALSPASFLQVKVGNHTAEGTGTNKKVAKRNAAENMLEILGFKVPQAQPAKPALKSEEKVTVRGFMSLLSNCKMISPHPGGLWHFQGQPSFRAGLHPGSNYDVIRRRVACPWLQAGLWVESLLLQYRCGLGCFARGQAACSSPFVG